MIVALVRADFSEAALDELKTALGADGLDTYETKVGGSGFGVMRTETIQGSAESQEGGAEAALVPDMARFRTALPLELAAWADKASGWSYV